MLVSAGLCWSVLDYAGQCWTLLVSAGLCWSVLDYGGQCWTMLVSAGLCWPVLDYADYGCYCRLGGSGTPVDGLDSCCQVHDRCYSEALQHEDCWPILDNPYTEMYSYSCDKASKTVTCLSESPYFFHKNKKSVSCIF
uniref:Phospholipase A2 n=1 Tax=Amphiprion ocellaris TaxID=80972 RepID=A0A3Q1AV66_AMPOC